MAILNKGILGGFSGKVGNLVGVNYRGLNVIRSLPKKSKKKPTPAQLAQRMRFTTAVRFLSPLRSLIDIAYGVANEKSSRFSKCLSYNAKNAVSGVFPDLCIDPAKVIITTGTLVAAIHANAKSTNATCITMSWYYKEHRLSSLHDRAILIAYNPAKEWCIWSITDSNRASESAELTIPSCAGESVHCWLAFISPDLKIASMSTYLGAVNLNNY